MNAETNLTVISGYLEPEAPPELTKFLGLLRAMLVKIAAVHPSFRFMRGTDPMQTVSAVKPGDTVLFFLYPPLTESGHFTLILTGIMDKLMSSKDHANGQIILFSNNSETDESRILPEYIPGIKLRYDLSLVTGGKNRLLNQENMFDCLLDIAYGLKNNKEKLDVTDKNKERPAVFLAETTPDAEYYRSLLKNELEGMGYRVITPGSLHEMNATSRDILKNQISKCFLSVHMIGRTYGKTSSEGGQSFLEFQLEVAGQHAIDRASGMTGRMKRMIWIMPRSRKNDLHQESLINRIKQESHLFAESELLEIPFESFKTYLQKYLTATTSEKSEMAGSDQAYSDLFVIYDNKTAKTVKPLLEWLQKENIEFDVPRFEGTPDVVLSHYRRIISSCNSVLLYNTEGNEIWLRTKINDIRKAPGYGREKPFHSCMILTSSALDMDPGEPFRLISSSQKDILPAIEEKLKSILHHA